MEFEDYYSSMGVPRDATAEQIKKAYRKLARKYHPDVSKEKDAEVRFKEVGEAYELVSDPAKRAAYDQLGRDLHLDLPVAPWEAALGANVPVPTPGGTVDLRIPAGSKAGSRLRLRGRAIQSPFCTRNLNTTPQDTTVFTGVIVEEQGDFSLEELCDFCSVEQHRILELVTEGILETHPVTEWRFSGVALRRARIALRLQRDLGVNVAGTALVLQLLERIESLERRVGAESTDQSGRPT